MAREVNGSRCASGGGHHLRNVDDAGSFAVAGLARGSMVCLCADIGADTTNGAVEVSDEPGTKAGGVFQSRHTHGEWALRP